MICRMNNGHRKTCGSALAVVMLLSTSILLACRQPSGAPVAAPPQTSGQADAPLPSTGERTYRIVPQQSTASYQAQEKWLRWPAPTKAVAKTGDVDGELTLIMGDQPKLAANRFRVDMRTLVSEVADTPVSGPAGIFLAQRDQVVRNLLETGTYPFAQFTAAGLDGLPARYAEGQMVKVRVPGDLTVHGMTRPVLLETDATLQGETLTGTATTQIRLTDYGVQPPANNGAMDVEDQLTIVIKFMAQTTPIASSEMTLEERNPKLDTPLAMLARIARDRGTDQALAAADEMGLEVAADRLRIIVARSPAQVDRVRELVAAAGGEVEADEVSVAGALIPISAIEELADSTEIRAIRIPLRAE